MRAEHVRWIPASLGLTLAALWAASSGACLQISGLGDITVTRATPDAGADGPDIACQSAAQCDDADPCTTDTCSTQGICTFTPLPDGDAPPSSQKKGTCQKLVCKGGAASSVEDDTNVPAATDMCVTAACSMGKPTMMLAPPGTPCTLAGATGVCNGGACAVACKTAADCMNTNPCRTASCDGSTGMCVYADVADGTPTPGLTQFPGDCVTHICIAGADTAEPDPSDLPPKINDCQDPVCTPVMVDGGASGALMPGESFAKHPPDSPCSTYMGSSPGVCDGMGHCDQCDKDSECPGLIDDCQHPTCSNGSCTTTKTAAGTATTTNPPQMAGDCQKIVCDGNGGTMMVADNGDPPTYPNDCKIGSCNNGVPNTVNAPNTTHCPTPTGGFLCINGQCGCMKDSDCQPPANETCGGGGTPGVCGCTPTTCVKQSTTCGSISDACGGMLNCNDAKKDGNETDVDCGGNMATCANRCAQGQKCNATSDCQAGLTCADGVCCNTPCTGACQACTKAKTGQANGVDGVCQPVASGVKDPKNVCTSSAASTCGDDAGQCDGAGNCMLWPNGTTCVAASCAGTVLTKSETCLGGTCTPQGTQDCTPYLCGGSPAACTTSCTVDTDCAATAFCNAVQKCVAKRATGGVCSKNDQCQSGVCTNNTCQ